MKDPFVDEIRRVRRKLNKMLETNPAEFHADLEEIYRRHKGKVIYAMDPWAPKKSAGAKVRRGAP